MLLAEVGWIAAHRETETIRAVAGLGDAVNCTRNPVEFMNADLAFDVLDAAGIPYLPAVGNHDYNYATCGKVGARATTSFDAVAGPSRFAGRSWYGSSNYPPGSGANAYALFEVGTWKFLLLSLEFAPSDEAIAWASGILSDHPDRLAIVVTHVYMVSNVARRTITGDIGGAPPGYFEFTGSANSGDDLWNKLLRRHGNVFLVAGGHFAGTPTRLTSTTDVGTQVIQMCVDYQQDGLGGSGRLRRLLIRPYAGTVEATSFSPYLGTFLTDAANQFVASFSTSGTR
jgi:hypothetical protein